MDPREIGRTVARVEAALSATGSGTTTGLCVGVNLQSQQATINIAGGEQVMPWVGPAPWNGDKVRVLTLGQEPVCVPFYGAALGSVQVVSAGIARVMGDDGVIYSYPYPVGSAISSGDRVALDHERRTVALELSAEPPGSTYSPPAAPPAAATQDRWFYPIDSGNYRYGAYAGASVDISTTRSGFFWYGRQIVDSIPTSANILVAKLSLAEDYDNVPGTPSQMGTHTQDGMHGATPPGITGSYPVSNAGEVDLIAAGYANALKTGAAFGFGFAQNTGYRSFGTKSYSGGVHIVWA